MTTEEKAKAYDEALALMADCVPDEYGLVHVRPHEIFSELKESEDERISREITEFILTHRIDEPNDIEDTNSWLAWLEKQAPKKWSEEVKKAELRMLSIILILLKFIMQAQRLLMIVLIG